eukprot:TRINITY_DN10915_c0_g1_i1.p2 TRINITY_DN10915_c0_g1~~TRINITY_DN10915_c0_g1_i1.p2  ORF type:complete len:206 (+),score=9.24 TRINITY_DN10915_c0_g1_i1:90-707(+)
MPHVLSRSLFAVTAKNFALNNIVMDIEARHHHNPNSSGQHQSLIHPLLEHVLHVNCVEIRGRINSEDRQRWMKRKRQEMKKPNALRCHEKCLQKLLWPSGAELKHAHYLTHLRVAESAEALAEELRALAYYLLPPQTPHRIERRKVRSTAFVRIQNALAPVLFEAAILEVLVQCMVEERFQVVQCRSRYFVAQNGVQVEGLQQSV